MAANGAGPSTSSNGNGSTYDAKNDPAIFRDDGFIVFPRSDGDPDYGPPNTQVPPASATEVNYFHIWSPRDLKYDRWCLVIGADLAHWAGKPELSPSGTKWKLKAFPDNYTFAEHRKGSKKDVRTDQYLYGE